MPGEKGASFMIQKNPSDFKLSIVKTIISLHSTPLRSVPLGFNQCLQLADKVIVCVKLESLVLIIIRKIFKQDLIFIIMVT